MELYTMEFEETSENSTVTFDTTGSGKRAIIFGVNAE